MNGSIAGLDFVRLVSSDPIAEVWEGRQHSPSRTVTIRVFAHPVLLRPECRPYVMDELRRAATLNHPSLPVVYDVGTLPDGRIYSLSEWVTGENLLDCVAHTTNQPERMLFQAAADLARALQYAWDQCGLAHGHLRPEDIVISPQGYPQVLNFGQTGIAAIRKAMPGSREFLNLLSDVPFYTAPELVRAQSIVDFRADIYSLGAILYHAVTGRAPFRESSRSEALDKHLFGQIEDPVAVNPKCSPHVAWLLEKMMIKDPVGRPASWTEVIADLEAVRDRKPPAKPWPEAGRSTVSRSPERNGKSPRKGRGITVAAPVKATVLSASELAEVRQVAERPRRSGLPLLAIPISIGLVALAGAAIHHLHKQGYFRFNPEDLRPLDPMEDAIRRGQIRMPGETDEPATPRPPPVVQEPRPTRPQPGPAEPPLPSLPAPGTPRPPVPPPVSITPPPPVPMAPARGTEVEDPDLARGRQSFNSAVAIYDRLKVSANVGDVESLNRIDALCRQAMQSFETYKKNNPEEEKRATSYLESCYSLQRTVRSLLLQNGGHAGGSRTTPSSGSTRPVIPAPPSSVDSVRPRPAPVSPPAAGAPSASLMPPAGDLKLAAAWNRPYTGAVEKRAAKDLQDLLSPRGQAAVDTKAQAIALVANISYLAAAADAASALGGQAGETLPLTSAAFPAGSFKARVLAGDFNGYPSARLICDLADQVVALQYVDERPRESTVQPAAFFTDQWIMHDLVMGKLRSPTSQLIAHRSKASAELMIIDSELAESRPDGTLRSIARYSLVLPKPMVNLLLARTKAGGL